MRIIDGGSYCSTDDPALTLNVDSRRRRVKRRLEQMGIHSIDPLWKPLAIRLLRRKLADDRNFASWYEAIGQEAVAKHWGPHDPVRDEFSQLQVGSQLYEITELLRRRIGRPDGRAVLDAGASDGLFLRRIGAQDGVGVNLLDQCVQQIASDGFRAQQGDLENLPFDDDSFPVVICCETLEHVPNPVAALSELGRVCSGRIYLTIPWLPRTRISPRPPGWPSVESHIFEFSEADFARVVTHTNVRIVYQDSVEVFPQPHNPLLQLWLSVLMYPNFFPKLQYYELDPTS